MTTYAAPQVEAVSAQVGPAAPRPATPPHASQPLPTAASGATAVAYVPPSAVFSGVHHHTTLQPNRHHPLPDNSWHDHHARLKENHMPPPRLPPPLSQPLQVPSRHAKVEKSGNPLSQSIHDSHTDNRDHEPSSHVRQRLPETAHSYHHTVNVMTPHHPGSRMTAPTHHTSYLYPVHPLVAPVAHVPIGAAHYAHLPPSIWSPPHAHYHQHPHPQAHPLPPAHHVSPAIISTPHGQVPYAASHVHHVTAPTHPSAHAYALPAPHSTRTPHPQASAPPHAVHPPPHHPQQHITYAYAQVQAPPPTHHAVKTAVAVSASQPVAIGVPYSMSAAHLPHAGAGTAVSAQMPCKPDPVLAHASYAEHPPPRNSNCLLAATEEVKPYEMNANRTESVRMRNGTNDRSDKSPPRGSRGRPVSGEGTAAYGRAPDERKEPNRKEKEKGQLAPGQPIRKPRKPYTIKKSREVWTPEEHSRFLQALQLYDRDWKKIETYIGTKTVLQIRSHAQKHFGKVTKYKTGEYIPPPRPKKRAALPYPRSRSTGQSRSNSANGSTADKTAGGESGVQSARDMSTKNQTDAIKFSADGKQGSPTLSGTINGSTRGTPVASDTHSKRPVTNPPHATAIEATEPRSGSLAYGDKYASSSYEHQDENRGQESANRGKLPHTNALTRWHPTPRSEERVREQVPPAPRGSSSSTDIKAGVSSYASEPHVYQRRSSSCSEDLEEREMQYERHYRQGTSLVSSDNNSGSQREKRHSPKRMSFKQSAEHDTSTIKEASRKRMAVPNNSLLVLSNCVDLMSRDTVPERQPAAGWATAAAARRAHRAKIIRARKPPLPQPSIPMQADDPTHRGKGNLQREILDADMLEEQSRRHARDHDVVLKTASSRLGSRSPQVNSPSEYGCDQAPPDPQRSSTGSGTGSDDAIAGFSSSDRPSVSGSAAGSGTGGSLETSDAGDPEEDPKSSNDGGSGDDGNRRSPPTRDSSPGDPTSSGSGENSPNECPPSQPSDSGTPEQLDSALQKGTIPRRNGLTPQRYEQASHRDKTNMGSKNLRTGTTSSHGYCENRRYGVDLENNDKVLPNEDNSKSHALPRTVISPSREDQIPLYGRSPRTDRGSHMHHDTVHKVSPSSKKRQRSNMECDIHSRTDGRIAANGRDPESKRQRSRHTVQEPNYDANQTYYGRDFAERNR